MPAASYDPDEADRLEQRIADDLLDGRSLIDQIRELVSWEEPNERN